MKRGEVRDEEERNLERRKGKEKWGKVDEETACGVWTCVEGFPLKTIGIELAQK